MQSSIENVSGVRRTSLQASTEPGAAPTDATLSAIQRRVLWIATNMVHHANRVRPNPSGIKVGGHQASSASVVTILTELFFEFMRAGDQLSVKPHASPVLHAIHYLLGNLDRGYLTRLREFHGLQAYPSRTKDPDPIDFSTGSVGLGCVAPNFACLVDAYVRGHFGDRTPTRRFISLVGDAELDEGSVWEAVAEPALAGQTNLVWIIDVNRQSLDRVAPSLRVLQLEEMFRANGWAVVEAKYGTHLQKAFLGRHGDSLRRTLDEMSNEEYQFLVRSPEATVRRVLGKAAPSAEVDARELIGDLGGHDFPTLRAALSAADAAAGPSVVFAYTMKGWGLPIAGDPMNHSALLSLEQMAELRRRFDIPEGDDWPLLEGDALKLASRRREDLRPPRQAVPAPSELPNDLNRSYRGTVSTQRAFGEILLALSRTSDDLARRLVTASPDVATSTNLGGWINKVGVWDRESAADPFTQNGPRLIDWRRGPAGQHIELGISETNLMMLLGQLGLASEMAGQTLLPIGTLYDPFVARALDALMYSTYSGSRFILVGTPSGVTLAAEGGAHQSLVTPTIGLATPRLTYWEPCFAQELEWIVLDALAQLQNTAAGMSSYLRLSTAGIDQGLMPTRADRDALRGEVLSGCYCLVDRSHEPAARLDNTVDIWATGVMVPQALCAADELLKDGVYATVWNCVSPDLVYRRWQTAVRSSFQRPNLPWGRQGIPVVTVVDGHPSALAWVGSMLGARAYPLGVTDYGQSGLPADLYSEFHIDAEAITMAAYAALND